MRATKRLRRLASGTSLLAFLTLAAACDSGPEGPGFLTGTLEGPIPLGAAVLEVTGAGVLGFEGAGTTHVISRPSAEGVHRVVLIGEAPGDLRFRIHVAEVRDATPSATLMEAADGGNQSVTSVQAFQVRIVR
jgi:hypothetical protein